MSTIIFMAVQCCQCSTMQVKQRKNKSNSNKWVCVVCNQRQSIRKVFGEASMSKELRPFVQSFNMSRHSHSSQAPPMAEPLCCPDLKRPRSDWTEFLDPPNHQALGPEPELGENFGQEIVTELPVKMRGYNRNASKRTRFSRENKPGNHVEEEESENSVRKASKWRHYVSQEDGDGVGVSAGESVDDWRSLMNEEKVEDEEVHPDFL